MVHSAKCVVQFVHYKVNSTKCTLQDAKCTVLSAQCGGSVCSFTDPTRPTKVWSVGFTALLMYCSHLLPHSFFCILLLYYFHFFRPYTCWNYWQIRRIVRQWKLSKSLCQIQDGIPKRLYMIILGAPVEVNKTQGKILPRQWRHNIATECCKSIPIRFPRPKSPPSWLNKSSFWYYWSLLCLVCPSHHFILISKYAFRDNYCETTTLWSFSSRPSDPSFSHHFRQDPHVPPFNFSFDILF